ncbi:M17 family metallopeptidase [Rhodococcus sp. IEGM 1408]|uniref:leucyl aminopeptidase family protein n=1 Tax=Rhodococcus sp. IEGM 1408 TaxID=3082220 RepID=UPI0029532C5D|nr:M17 family metallopeptidase [Rhodococcus sp. IEGM 1408]MDV8000598.1 M17 family metallopeptidase [Rhodococcus sp. IEGM 1408]
MSEIPSRPLPGVRVASGRTTTSDHTTPPGHAPAAGSFLVTRSPEPGRAPRGHAVEARASTRGGRSVVEVEVDATAPRPGWAGAVDVGIGYRRAGAAVARHLRDARHADELVVSVPGQVPVGRVGDLVLGYLLGARGQDVFAARPEPVAPDLVVEVSPGADGGSESRDDDEAVVSAAVAAAVDAARATALARDLAGAPADLKTPEWLVSRMSEALTAAGMQAHVIEGEELEESGFGGVLAVGGGSAAAPRVLVARRPGTGPRVLLVGKGITFDTGGISVKPAEGMHLMRTDMGGSAAVVAAAAAFCADDRDGYAGLDLTVVVPSAENMLSGSAYRPGDVVTHVGGTTSEVTNTDAEGRMVLADALAHGIAECDPDVVVDVATLTGAMKVALGMRTGAVMATDDDLADRVSQAGAGAGERWWRLPLPDNLRGAVSSTIADRRQAPKGPGAITAALFLEGFVDGRPWAHLDIAGPARSPEEIDEVGPVATGFATRTLLGLLRGLVDRPRA